MNALEMPLGLGLAAVLVLVAGYYALGQRRTLALLHDPDLAPAERGYFKGQMLRRFLTCALLVVMAGFLIGWFFINDLSELRPPPGDGGAQAIPEASKDGLRFLASYWMFALLDLLAILVLAVMDLWATARHGWWAQQQLERDRRAMLEAEAARLRARPHERN